MTVHSHPKGAAPLTEISAEIPAEISVSGAAP